MIVHTCFNNCSEHGYSSNILKSGICKYFRRGESEKFKWCVIEMSLFHDHPKGNGLITNLINRLKIYREKTSPLIELYAKQGILKEIEGNADIDVVFSCIEKALGG